MNNFKKLFLKASSVMFWLLLWEITAYFINKKLLLPSPYEVLLRFFEMIKTSGYWQTVTASVLRVVSGLIIGIAAAVLLTVISFVSKTVKEFLSPLIIAVRSTPVASIIVLFLIWIGKELVPSVISFLMVLPVIYDSLSGALKTVDKELSEVADLYGVVGIYKVYHFYIPSVLPMFYSSCVTACGLAWKAGIAAEVLCTPLISIGKEIYQKKLYLETTDLFVWTVSLVMLSVIIEKLLKFLIKIISGEKI